MIRIISSCGSRDRLTIKVRDKMFVVKLFAAAVREESIDR